MKTILARMKTVLIENDTLENYVMKVETVAPRTLPLLSLQDLPYIGLAPTNAPEQWVAQRKETTNTIEAYLVLLYHLQEFSIIGDESENQKGILDFVADFKSAIRGNLFPSDLNDAGTNYLSKPTDIVGVDFATEPWGDDLHLIISTVTLECIRLFNA